MSGVIHADTRTLGDSQAPPNAIIRDMKIFAQQVVPVEPPVDMHRLAEQSGTLRPAFHVAHRFDRAQQHRRRQSLALRNDIHAVMHAIYQIDIRVSGWTEHDFGPWREASRGMRREIVRPEIGFNLNDPADPFHAPRAMNEILVEQIAGH